MKLATAVTTLVFASTLFADTTTIVTPSSLSGWHPANERGGGQSLITSSVPRTATETGSLQQSLPAPTSPSPKTDYQLFSPDTALVGTEPRPTSGFGKLSEVTSLSFDWYRSSTSSASGHFTPVIRLWVWDPQSNTSALLIWEGIYNGYPSPIPVPTDQWIVQQTVAGNFWRVPQFVNGTFVGISGCAPSPGVYNCYVFNRGLDDWGFSSDTVVFGIEVGLGSGWPGTYLSYADNVSIGFNGVKTTWNFENPVPYSCAGFEAPFNQPLTLKSKSNRAIPLRIQLYDPAGNPVTGDNIGAAAPPVVNVTLNGFTYGNPATSDAGLLPAGQSSDGNQMRPDGAYWVYNLATKQFSASGTYVVTIMAGDSTYAVLPTCSQTFTINP